MSSLKVRPLDQINAEIRVPGDKSISHRSIMFASLAEGPTRITGFLPGEDCLSTLKIFQALGVRIEVQDSTTVCVEGTGKKLKAPSEPLDCGNSGTTMRLISGILAAQPFSVRLFGDASLSNRPMKRIIDPLSQMGAQIKALGLEGRPPLEITGGPLQALNYTSKIASAQLKSAILLAGLFATGTTRVTEPEQSRDHTERLLEHFHVHPVIDGLSVSVHGGSTLHGNDLAVPGDFSSAAFWIVAAACLSGASLSIRQVGLNPTRTGLLGVLLRMGAQLRESIDQPSAEPSGTLQVFGSRLKGTEIKGAEIPNVIDELPIIAVAGALAEGDTTISDAAELRVKETDRIKAMAGNLRAFGVEVDEKPDGMIIHGGADIKAAKVESFGDHRIAMACAILGLFADGTSIIEDVACVDTSYPGFAKQLKKFEGGTFWPLKKKRNKKLVTPEEPPAEVSAEPS